MSKDRETEAKTTEARVLAKGRYLTMIEESGWEYVTRPGVTGIVVIVATTKDRRLVLVEQYRRGRAQARHRAAGRPRRRRRRARRGDHGGCRRARAGRRDRLRGRARWCCSSKDRSRSVSATRSCRSSRRAACRASARAAVTTRRTSPSTRCRSTSCRRFWRRSWRRAWASIRRSTPGCSWPASRCRV